MFGKLALFATTLLVTAAVAGATVGAEGEKMTICHKPHGSEGAGQTMQVSRSAWNGHRGHGDHEGACKATATGVGTPSPPPRPEPVRTAIVLLQTSEGDLDGRATFKVTVANDGQATALGLEVAGTVDGDGRWRLEPSEGVHCGMADGRLRCRFPDLPAGRTASVTLHYQALPAVCGKAATDLTLSAQNDATSGDDRRQAEVRVGYCPF